MQIQHPCINFRKVVSRVDKAIFKSIRDLYVALGGVEKINAYAAACQIWLETGGTSSELSHAAFNFAGIKATDQWKKAGGEVYRKVTKEVINGREVTVSAEFRKYTSPLHFFQDYSAKWQESRYVKAGLQDNLGSFWLCFAALNTGGWATDLSYFTKLCAVADSKGFEVFGTSWTTKKVASLEYAVTSKILTATQKKHLTELLTNAKKLQKHTEKVSKESPEAVQKSPPLKTTAPVVVGIDAGHGGKDSGAINPTDRTIQEKNITLATALLLRAKLIEAGCSVVMTRDTDTTVELNDRPKLLNSKKVDFTVSIHTNSVANSPNTTGFEAYVYLKSSNKSRDLCNRIYNEWNIEFPGTKLRDDTTKAGLYKSANFAMVRDTTNPAVLVEMDFISNNDMAKKMNTKEYQARMCKALFYAILSYIKANH